jgi:hypothetical protein
MLFTYEYRYRNKPINIIVRRSESSRNRNLNKYSKYPQESYGKMYIFHIIYNLNIRRTDSVEKRRNRDNEKH